MHLTVLRLAIVGLVALVLAIVVPGGAPRLDPVDDVLAPSADEAVEQAAARLQALRDDEARAAGAVAAAEAALAEARQRAAAPTSSPDPLGPTPEQIAAELSAAEAQLAAAHEAAAAASAAADAGEADLLGAARSSSQRATASLRKGNDELRARGEQAQAALDEAYRDTVRVAVTVAGGVVAIGALVLLERAAVRRQRTDRAPEAPEAEVRGVTDDPAPGPSSPEDGPAGSHTVARLASVLEAARAHAAAAQARLAADDAAVAAAQRRLAEATAQAGRSRADNDQAQQRLTVLQRAAARVGAAQASADELLAAAMRDVEDALRAASVDELDLGALTDEPPEHAPLGARATAGVGTPE